MKTSDKQFSEMLARVLDFGIAFPHVFELNSLGGRLVDEFCNAAREYSDHKIAEALEVASAKDAFTERFRARADLCDLLRGVSRAAWTLKLGGFDLPRKRHDWLLIELGRAFARLAEPHRRVFVAACMVPDFIEQLEIAAQRLEQSIRRQASTRNALADARTGIEKARTDVIGALQRLDPILKNVLRDKPALFTRWRQCL